MDGRAGMWAGTWRVRFMADTAVRARRGMRKRKERNRVIVAGGALVV